MNKKEITNEEIMLQERIAKALNQAIERDNIPKSLVAKRVQEILYTYGFYAEVK